MAIDNVCTSEKAKRMKETKRTAKQQMVQNKSITETQNHGNFSFTVLLDVEGGS